MELERFKTGYLLAVAGLVAFVALAAIVTTGATQELDDSLRQVFRPDDVWGIWQLIFGNVVDGLAPPVALALLALAGIVVAARTRSARPLGYVAVLSAVGVVVTVVSKAVLQRPDPHGDTSALGGSFPSGHMVILLVSLAGAALVWRAHPPWWVWWALVVVELTMGLSLLLLTMHWFTDVIGGGLLAVPIVALASTPRLLALVHRGPRPPAVDSVGSPT